jgi:hypothetical protein
MQPNRPLFPFPDLVIAHNEPIGAYDRLFLAHDEVFFPPDEQSGDGFRLAPPFNQNRNVRSPVVFRNRLVGSGTTAVATARNPVVDRRSPCRSRKLPVDSPPVQQSNTRGLTNTPSKHPSTRCPVSPPPRVPVSPSPRLPVSPRNHPARFSLHAYNRRLPLYTLRRSQPDARHVRSRVHSLD